MSLYHVDSSGGANAALSSSDAVPADPDRAASLQHAVTLRGRADLAPALEGFVGRLSRGKARAVSETRYSYPFFEMHGIEVNKYTVEIPEKMYTEVIRRAGNNWTTRWKQWNDANPNATTAEVYQFGGILMDEYGLRGHPLVPCG